MKRSLEVYGWGCERLQKQLLQTFINDAEVLPRNRHFHNFQRCSGSGWFEERVRLVPL